MAVTAFFGIRTQDLLQKNEQIGNQLEPPLCILDVSLVRAGFYHAAICHRVGFYSILGHVGKPALGRIHITFLCKGIDDGAVGHTIHQHTCLGASAFKNHALPGAWMASNSVDLTKAGSCNHLQQPALCKLWLVSLSTEACIEERPKESVAVRVGRAARSC